MDGRASRHRLIGKSLSVLLAFAMLMTMLPGTLLQSTALADSSLLSSLTLSHDSMAVYVDGTTAERTKRFEVTYNFTGGSSPLYGTPSASATSDHPGIVSVEKISSDSLKAVFEVTAQDVGTADITVTVSQTVVGVPATKTGTVHVTSSLAPSYLESLTLGQESLTLVRSGPGAPQASVSYVAGLVGNPDITVTASSTDTSIASVHVVDSSDPQGTVNVTGLAEGDVTVRITVTDGTNTEYKDLAVRVEDPATPTPTPAPTATPKLVDMALAPSSIVLDLNEDNDLDIKSVQYILGVTGDPSIDVTASSSDDTIATALVNNGNETVLVTGLKVGKTTVRVTATDGTVIKSIEIPVTVIDTTTPPPEAIVPTGVQFTTSTLSINIPFASATAAGSLGYLALPAGLTFTNPVTAFFSSSAPDVVSVGATSNLLYGNDGQLSLGLTAHKAGEAQITVLLSTGQSATATVTVTKDTIESIPANQLLLSAHSLTLTISTTGVPETRTIPYSILPTNYNTPFGVIATGAVSGDAGIVNGVTNSFFRTLTLTAVAAGQTTVTVTSPLGIQDAIVVNVVQLEEEVVEPESIAFDLDTLRLPLHIGAPNMPVSVGYTVSPSYFTGDAPTVLSYTPAVATATMGTDGTVTIEPVGVGQAEVVIKTWNGKTDSLMVTVVSDADAVPSESVAFTPDTISTKLTSLYPQSLTAPYLILPTSTTDSVKSVVSSNDSIVRVASINAAEGSVSLLALRAGDVVITLTTVQGLQAQLNVHVDPFVTEIGAILGSEVVPLTPVSMFKDDVATVNVGVLASGPISASDIAVTSENGNISASVGTITPAFFGLYNVPVNISGVKPGADLLSIRVGEKTASVAVRVYDIITAADISVDPAIAEITTGDSLDLALVGLDDKDTTGYTFVWSVPYSMASGTYVLTSDSGLNARLATFDGCYGELGVGVQVMPPVVTVGTNRAVVSASSLVRVHQSGKLFISVASGAIIDTRDLTVGNGVLFPVNAVTLSQWKDGAPITVASPTFKFSSSDPSVVKVDSDSGYLNPIGAGSADITITGYDNLHPELEPATYTFSVDVVQLPNGISAPASLTVNTGRDLTIGATLLPAGVSGYLHYDLLVPSFNVRLYDTGLFNATSAGVYTVIIRAYASIADFYTNRPWLSATQVKVTVKDEPTWVTMNNNARIRIHVGEQHTINLASYPAYNALKYGTVTAWYSENEDALKVVGDNTILGLAVCSGQYVYGVTTEGYRLYFLVDVYDVPVTGVAIVPAMNLKMLVGDIRKFSAMVLPFNADDPTITWSVADPAIASVDDIGNVTALSSGTTLLYATAASGVKASVQITVALQAEGVALDQTLIELYPGDDVPLDYTVLSAGAEISGVQWNFGGLPGGETGARWVAGRLYVPTNAVPGDYIVTASLYGTAYTGFILNSNALIGTDTVVIRVLQPVEQVELADVSGSVYGAGTDIKGLVGQQIVVRGIVSPSDAANQNLVWDVADSDIAKVEPLPPFGEYARVTYLGKGTTQLFVKSQQSSASDQIALIVGEEMTDFALDPTYKEIYPGESFTYGVTLIPTDTMLVDKIKFSSSSAAASVNDYGMVIGVKPGTAEITATYTNILGTVFTRKATVVVKNPVLSLQFMDGSVATESMTMMVGDSCDIKGMLEFVGVDASSPVSDDSVRWVIEKGNIVSIDGNGTLRALAPGNTWVYAYAHNDVYAKVLITVTQDSDHIALSTYNLLLWPGELGDITATLTPADSTDTLKWTLSSGQTSIQIINEDDRTISFKATNPGVVEVIATTYDATSFNVTATKKCIVTVKTPAAAIQVDSIEPQGAYNASGTDGYPKTTTATYIGQKIQLTAKVLPTDAYDQSVTWSVWNPAIATVDPVSGLLTTVGVGTTAAVATSNADGTVKGWIYITVVRNLLQFYIEPTEADLYWGESFQIDPYLLPAGAELPDVDYQISSSDPGIVSIRSTKVSSGKTICKVTGLKTGVAVITATIFGNTATPLTATCIVNVLTPVEKLTVKKDRIRMLVGDQYHYDLADDLIFNNDDPMKVPADKSVTYTSRNEDIVTVDSMGQITANKVGQTIIDIVSDQNPNVRAQVIVEVVDLAAGIVADAAEIRVYPGEKIPVNFTFTPDAIATKNLIWTFANAQGAAMDDATGKAIAEYRDGFIYTKSSGFVKMIATVELPQDIVDLYATKYPSLKLKQVSTSILVTVLKPVESVTIDTLNQEALTSDALTYIEGENFLLHASVTPADADDPEIIWTSSDPNIASVDSFGIVTCYIPGTVKIYATSHNTGAQDFVTLTVEKKPYQTKYGVTTAKKLFIRTIPDLQGFVIGSFPYKTPVTIVGEYGMWYEILYPSGPNGVAYIHRNWVRITGVMQPDSPDTVPGTIIIESNAQLNTFATIWSGYGSGYKTYASAGTRVLLLGKVTVSGTTYYRISYGHENLGVGYVLASSVTPDAGYQYGKGTVIMKVPAEDGYVSYIIDPGTGASIKLEDTEPVVVNIPSTVTAASAPIYSGFTPADHVLIGRVYSGTSLTILSEKTNGYYKVSLSNGVIGWIEAMYIAQPASGYIVTKTTVTTIQAKAKSNINLRSGPSTSYSKVGTIKKNAIVTVLNETPTNGYYQVKTAAGVVGYASTSYLILNPITTEVETKTPVVDQYGIVNASILNVRERPALDAAIIGTVKSGEQLRIVMEMDGWYHVEVPDGSLGFVKSDYIVLIDND